MAAQHTSVTGLHAQHDATALVSLCCAAGAVALTFATARGLVRVVVPAEASLPVMRGAADSNGRPFPVAAATAAVATVERRDAAVAGSRDVALEVARAYLAEQGARNIAELAAERGVSASMLQRAVSFARANPGARTWPTVPRGGNRLCDAARIEEYRDAWRRYVAEPDTTVAELAYGIGLSHQQLSVWFRRFDAEAGRKTETVSLSEFN